MHGLLKPAAGSLNGAGLDNGAYAAQLVLQKPSVDAAGTDHAIEPVALGGIEFEKLAGVLTVAKLRFDTDKRILKLRAIGKDLAVDLLKRIGNLRPGHNVPQRASNIGLHIGASDCLLGVWFGSFPRKLNNLPIRALAFGVAMHQDVVKSITFPGLPDVYVVPEGGSGGDISSVNGQTGTVRTSWYFDVTGSVASPATTQTVAQIVAAQEAGFAPICSATFSDFQGLPATLPALLISDMACVFGGIGSTGGDTFYLTVMIDGAGTLTAKTDDVAAKGDIPKIPTSLKNPNALSIKVGDNTTSYDGSAAKSVEIPAPTYSLTETDKEDIAADVIAGGQEVQVGEPLAGPTDTQVSSAVSSWLTEHPEATTTVQDGSVSVEKLGYGKHIPGSKPYFCGAVGTGAQVFGSIGVVVPCKAGDIIYTSITVPTNVAWNVPKILTAFPENQYGDIASITLENLAVNNNTKQYAIGADKTTAKALYIPQNFNAIPAANNGSVEDALAWINNAMGTDGRWCAQNVPFTELDAWYQTAQTELFDIDKSCNKLMYASLYQAVSKLVGAKVAVLGDSLTEQSACSFITSAYNDRWMENVLRDTALTGDDGKTYKGSGWFALIARKYKIKWWCAGHGAQWWYSTTERPNGATAMVRKLIDGTDEFDYIVLEYGTNDILSGYTHIGTAADEASETATTSCGAIKWCIEQLQTRFPEASIVVILPNIRSGANGEAPATQQAYLDAVVPILKKYGVRRVHMAEDSGIVKSMMSTDGVHLRWPVVRGGVTYYTNDTPAVRKFSKCLEAELLKA